MAEVCADPLAHPSLADILQQLDSAAGGSWIDVEPKAKPTSSSSLGRRQAAAYCKRPSQKGCSLGLPVDWRWDEVRTGALGGRSSSSSSSTAHRAIGIDAGILQDSATMLKPQGQARGVKSSAASCTFELPLDLFEGPRVDLADPCSGPALAWQSAWRSSVGTRSGDAEVLKLLWSGTPMALQGLDDTLQKASQKHEDDMARNKKKIASGGRPTASPVLATSEAAILGQSQERRRSTKNVAQETFARAMSKLRELEQSMNSRDVASTSPAGASLNAGQQLPVFSKSGAAAMSRLAASGQASGLGQASAPVPSPFGSVSAGRASKEAVVDPAPSPFGSATGSRSMGAPARPVAKPHAAATSSPFGSVAQAAVPAKQPPANPHSCEESSAAADGPTPQLPQSADALVAGSACEQSAEVALPVASGGGPQTPSGSLASEGKPGQTAKLEDSTTAAKLHDEDSISAEQKLEAEESALQDFKKDATHKDFRNQTKKTVNMLVAKISANWRSIREGTMALCDFLQKATDEPDLVKKKFIILCVAYRLSDEARVAVKAHCRAAWPLAHVAARVFSQNPLVEDLFLAHLLRWCPYLHGSFEGSGAGRRGHARGQEPHEPFSEFMDRMTGCQRLWLALRVVQQDLGAIWQWMARTLNAEPVPLSATLVHTALEMAGNAMQMRYQRQFIKIVAYIETEYLPAADLLKGKVSGEEAATLNASLSRLRLWLQEFARRRIAPPPEGGRIDAAQESELREDI